MTLGLVQWAAGIEISLSLSLSLCVRFLWDCRSRRRRRRKWLISELTPGVWGMEMAVWFGCTWSQSVYLDTAVLFFVWLVKDGIVFFVFCFFSGAIIAVQRKRVGAVLEGCCWLYRFFGTFQCRIESICADGGAR